MAYVFGSGEVTMGTLGVIGTLQDVSLDVSFQSIPLMGAYQFPVAIARGPASVKGSAKSGEFSSTMLSLPLVNNLMGAGATPLTVTWEVTPYGGGSAQTFTLNGVTITSWKLQAGNDKWLVTDISFEASAAAGGNVLTVA